MEKIISYSPFNLTPTPISVKVVPLTFHHWVFIAIVPIQSRVSSTWQLVWEMKS